MNAKFLNFILRSAVKPFVFTKHPTVKRLKLSALLLKTAELLVRIPREVKITQVKLDKFDAEWIDAVLPQPKRVILYMHGGGYCSGSPATHRDLTRRLAKSCECRIFAIDYRMIPDNVFPCWIDDAVAAYNYLLEQNYKPHNIVFAGDSAGGNLVLAALMTIRDTGGKMPAAAVCISPWADISCSGSTVISNKKRDALLRSEVLIATGQYISKASGYDVRNPKLSPLFGSYKNLPPLLIHTSDQEILFDDAKGVANAARRDKVKVTYREFNDLPHVFHIFASFLPQASTAIDEIGEFVKESFDKRTLK